MSFSRGSSWPRDWTQVSCTAGRFFTIWATMKAPSKKRKRRPKGNIRNPLVSYPHSVLDLHIDASLISSGKMFITSRDNPFKFLWLWCGGLVSKPCPTLAIPIFVLLFFFFFWLCPTAHGILVPLPGIEPAPSALVAQNLNHETLREVPSQLQVAL